MSVLSVPEEGKDFVRVTLNLLTNGRNVNPGFPRLRLTKIKRMTIGILGFMHGTAELGGVQPDRPPDVVAIELRNRFLREVPDHLADERAVLRLFPLCTCFGWPTPHRSFLPRYRCLVSGQGVHDLVHSVTGSVKGLPLPFFKPEERKGCSGSNCKRQVIHFGLQVEFFERPLDLVQDDPALRVFAEPPDDERKLVPPVVVNP